MTGHAVAVPVTTVWTAPDAPRDVDAAAVADRPDLAGWTASMDAASRLGLHGRTLTQALLGEPLVPVEERDGWVRIILPWQPSRLHPDGYPGWVPATHIGSGPRPSDRTVAVTTPTATCRTPDGATTVSYGTILPVLDDGPDETTVGLPGDREGTLPTSQVRAPGPSPVAAGWVQSLLGSARQFIGLRYLWAGTSGWGFDCSGYVHLVHRVHGREIPRDALDQMPAARPVPLEAVRPGDLYFFARPGELPFHVGYVTGPAGSGQHTMLHAPEEDERIEEAALPPKREETLVGAGSFASEEPAS